MTQELKALVTLAELINEYGASGYIYCDAGNGCGFGEDGQFITYDEDADAASSGQVELAPLDAPAKSADGVECHFASDWIITGEGDNPYRYKLMF